MAPWREGSERGRGTRFATSSSTPPPPLPSPGEGLTSNLVPMRLMWGVTEQAISTFLFSELDPFLRRYDDVGISFGSVARSGR